MTQLDRRQRNERAYGLLHVSEEDLRQAASYATYLLKKGWHSEETEVRKAAYLQQSAFTTALVMAYTRPFTQTRSGSTLNGRTRSGFTDEQKQLHRKMGALRDHLRTLRHRLSSQ